jgi:membrane protease YdiL (CAAX protease family)
MRTDLLGRLLPFALACGLVYAFWQPPWLGLSPGRPAVQLGFGLAGLPVGLAGGAWLQLRRARSLGLLKVPASPAAAALEAAYYALNAPVEEAFFRGLVQGGLGTVLGPAAGFLIGTSAYVLYHRLGGWSWPDVAATALAGVPLGLAFWLLPGPPSLLGVSLAHAGATCGFLGPGSYLALRASRR